MLKFALRQLNKGLNKDETNITDDFLIDKWESNVKDLQNFCTKDAIQDYIIFWDKTFGNCPFSDINITSKLVLIERNFELTKEIVDRISTIHHINKNLSNVKQIQSAKFDKIIFIILGDLKLWEQTFNKLFKFIKVKYVDILTTDKHVHSISSRSSSHPLVFLKRLLADWANTPLENINIIDKTLIMTPIGPRSFLLHTDPSTKSIGVLQNENNAEEYDELSLLSQDKYTSLSQSLYRLGSLLNYNLESWAIGCSSNILSDCLNESMKDSNETIIHTASLILIDRSLDLVMPCSLGIDNLVDRYYQFKDVKEYLKIEKEERDNFIDPFISLPMSNLVCDFNSSSTKDALDTQSRLMDPIKKSTKDIKDDLSFILDDLDIFNEKSKEMNTDDLYSTISALFNHFKVNDDESTELFISKYRHIISSALIALTFGDNLIASNPYIGSDEYTIIKHIMSTGDSFESLLEYGEQFINSTNPLKLISFVMLSIMLISIRSPVENVKKYSIFISKLKDIMKAHIENLVDNKDNQSYNSHFIDSLKKMNIDVYINRILDYLDHISSLRFNFDDHKDILYSNYIPMLKQILSRVLDNDKQLNDLKFKSYSVSGMLKSGISRFGLRNEPRPTDRKKMIIFIVGGITFAEIRYIHEVISTYNFKPGNILIGSNDISTLTKIHELIIKGQ